LVDLFEFEIPKYSIRLGNYSLPRVHSVNTWWEMYIKRNISCCCCCCCVCRLLAWWVSKSKVYVSKSVHYTGARFGSL
jgi:hypothetical protein